MAGSRLATLKLVTAIRRFRELLEAIEAEYEARGESFVDHAKVWGDIEKHGVWFSH